MPILFLIYINDLPSVNQALKKLFADDAKVYQIVSDMVEVDQFQTTLDNSVVWAEDWQMFYNFKKCKHMHLGNHDLEQTYTMKAGEERIPIAKVTSEKYLWVIIDNSLKFSEHVSAEVKIANRNLGLIFRTFTY